MIYIAILKINFHYHFIYIFLLTLRSFINNNLLNSFTINDVSGTIMINYMSEFR
ncbi:Uncharacterised protein [Mycobacterium tuberculosis]|nr:Uncharacterised protein [Mycobacterium tuberculosis]